MREAASELALPIHRVSALVLSGALNAAVLSSEPTAEDSARLDNLQVKLRTDRWVDGWVGGCERGGAV